MKKTLARITILASMLALCGCATLPRNIHPASVPKSPYVTMSCSDLADEFKAEEERLDRYSKKQKTDRLVDVALNVFVFPGVGAFTPDHEDEVAEAKGKIRAIDREILSRCGNQSTASKTK